MQHVGPEFGATALPLSMQLTSIGKRRANNTDMLILEERAAVPRTVVATVKSGRIIVVLQA